MVFVVESSDDEWSRSVLLLCSRRLRERTFSIAYGLSVRLSVRLSVCPYPHLTQERKVTESVHLVHVFSMTSVSGLVVLKLKARRST